MRLLITFLVAVALRGQHLVSAQCSQQCSCVTPDGSWSPLYKLLTSSPPSDNDIIPRGPPRCSCGCSPRRLPPRLPKSLPWPSSPPSPHCTTQNSGVSALSGMVIDSQLFQQAGPATVIQTPPAVCRYSSDVQGSSQMTYDSSPTHIMTIPRKQDSSVALNSIEDHSNVVTFTDDRPSTVTYFTEPNSGSSIVSSSSADGAPITTFSSEISSSLNSPNTVSFTIPQNQLCQETSYNSAIPSTPPTFNAPQPQPVYFAQPTALLASCPATLFYPANPAIAYAQPSAVYPATSSFPTTPAAPTSPQGFSSFPTQHAVCNSPKKAHSIPHSFGPSVAYSNENSPQNTYFSTSPTSASCNPPQLQSFPVTSQSFSPKMDSFMTHVPFDSSPPVTFTTTPSQENVCRSHQTVSSIPPNFGPGTDSSTAYSTNFNSSPTFLPTIPSQGPVCNYPQVPSSSSSDSQSFFSGTGSSTSFSNFDNFSPTSFSTMPPEDASCNTPQSQGGHGVSQIVQSNIFQNSPTNTITFSDSGSSTTGASSAESLGSTVTATNSPLTYTLLTSSTKDGMGGYSEDCSVPIPPSTS